MNRIQPYTELRERSWYFRTVGYAHAQESWRALIRELRLAGYDGPLSIKHEDALLSVDEDFIKAATFLHDTVMQEQPARAWWTE